MNHHYIVKYGDIILRPIRKKDIEKVRKLRNEYRFFFIHTDLISPEQQEKWYLSYLKKNNDFMFVIESENNDFLGTIALYHVNYETYTAEFGRIMTRKVFNAPKRVGTKAIIGLLIFAKEVLHLREVNCCVLKDNFAKKIYEQIGFTFLCEKADVAFYRIDLNHFSTDNFSVI